jgi:hypothetical protein
MPTLPFGRILIASVSTLGVASVAVENDIYVGTRVAAIVPVLAISILPISR